MKVIFTNRLFLFLSLFVLLFWSQFVIYSDNSTENSIDENYQRIIPIDSEIYDLVENLSFETGSPLLSGVRPWSEAEVLNILDQLDLEDLSSAGESAFSQIEKLLEKTSIYEEENFAADLSVEAGLEFYLHTSEDESQWQYGFEDRLSLLTLTAETWFNKGFYALIEPDIQESRFLIAHLDADGNYIDNFTNIPSEFGDINYHFPDRGFFSAGGENWNLQLGRDQLEYGNGETGKLMLSSYPDFYDFLKLKGFADNFAFTWTYINLESWSDTDHKTRFISDHAVEVRLFNMLTLYVNESALFYGEASELQFFNPLVVYRNLYEHSFSFDTGSNIYMTLGFNVVPFGGLSFYGEYLLDELQTWIEQAEYGTGVTSTPNAYGYMLGAKGSLPLGPGYLSGFFEYINTSPWCYLLDPEGGSIAWTHRETTDVLNKRVQVVKPLGYEYGPDTMSFTLSAEYLIPGKLSAGISADYILKGENTIETEYTDGFDAAALKTPSGTSQNSLIIDLNASYEVFSFMSLQADLIYLYINNFEHADAQTFSDLQFTAGVNFRI